MKKRRDQNGDSSADADRRSRRLQLRRETLRVLSDSELSQVRGGMDPCTMPGTATKTQTAAPPH
jgi:hypothetical protein